MPWRPKFVIQKNTVSKKEKLRILRVTFHVSAFKPNQGIFTIKKLCGSVGKICVLSDQNSRSNPRDKFVKTAFQDVGKSENIGKHEIKEYKKDTLEKAKDIIWTYADPTKSVTHGKNSKKSMSVIFISSK